MMLAAVIWALISSAAMASSCGPDHIDEQVRVAYIYDGDTVRLSDGRNLRFIGINTPEIGRKGKPSQTLAHEARSALQILLGPSATLSLRYDRVRHDHYQRLLAHPFLDDQTSIVQRLLEQGLATTLVVPPNVWNLECYLQAEQKARSKNQGIWNQADYQPVEVSKLTNNYHGFYIIKGTVSEVEQDQLSIWLRLPNSLSLRIAREDLPYFSSIALDDLVKKPVIARGWLHRTHGALQMRIRHPTSLRVQD